MKTKIVDSIAALLILLAIVFVGCKKDNNNNNTPTIPNYSKVATENASIEAAFTDAFRQVDKTCKENGVKDINTCPTVTITPFDLVTYPKDVEIDYGTSCLGTDGVYRSGKILAHLTKAYIDSSSVTTVTFDNYYVNLHHITGTEVITNLGKNQANHHVFGVEIQNGNLYSIDGVSVYNSTQQREWIAGDNTLLDPTDDVYLVTGTGSGTTTDGTAYTVNIVTPLQVAVGCAWIESGILNITIANNPNIQIDYGSGACDNAALVTWGVYSFNLVMQ
jgi:hypothetical protein